MHKQYTQHARVNNALGFLAQIYPHKHALRFIWRVIGPLTPVSQNPVVNTVFPAVSSHCDLGTKGFSNKHICTCMTYISMLFVTCLSCNMILNITVVFVSIYLFGIIIQMWIMQMRYRNISTFPFFILTITLPPHPPPKKINRNT